MRKNILLVVSLVWGATATVSAQSDEVKAVADKAEKAISEAKTAADEEPVESPWKIGGVGNATFNQVGLKNWSAGGDPSIAMLFQVNAFADYKKGKNLWQSYLATEYGLQKIRKESIRKNSDRFEIGTKYGYEIADKWYASVMGNFKTQFSKTKDFSQTDTTVILSKIMSPGSVELAIGIDYQPNDKFSLFMSPLAARMLFVLDDDIAALNIHGNEGKNFRKELGATVVATYKQEIVKNITVQTTLRLFKDYLQGPAQNIDVDWQTALGFKVNDYISASVFTHLIWDYDILNAEGKRKLQFKDVIGIGLSYKFGAKK
jgi:hypothetical protein